MALAVSVAIPWSLHAVNVTIAHLPNDATNPIGQNDVANAPATQTLRAACMTNGRVHFRVPGVHDGDAMYVVVTPALSRAGCATW
jgi:hypothetical protein